MSGTFFWRVSGPQKVILPRANCNVLQTTAVIKKMLDTWKMRVPGGSNLLSAKANQGQQDFLRLPRGRPLANFNESMTDYTLVALVMFVNERNLIRAYRMSTQNGTKNTFLGFFMREASRMRTATQSYKVEARTFKSVFGHCKLEIKT